MIRYTLVREELDDEGEVATATPLWDLPLEPGATVRVTMDHDDEAIEVHRIWAVDDTEPQVWVDEDDQ